MMSIPSAGSVCVFSADIYSICWICLCSQQISIPSAGSVFSADIPRTLNETKQQFLE